NVEFTHGGHNPSHDQMLALVTHNLDPSSFGRGLRRELGITVRGLQRLRLVADYVPGQTLDLTDALTQVRSASFVIKTLEAHA
ncbi:MAG: hypothetical protein AAFX76_05840, partial [Planctomycetota bacterium]